MKIKKGKIRIIDSEAKGQPTEYVLGGIKYQDDIAIGGNGYYAEIIDGQILVHKVETISKKDIIPRTIFSLADRGTKFEADLSYTEVLV